MATPAPACRAALAEATKLWPNRNRASDGIMGDPRHAAIRSDHNEGNAFDLTHDPADGVDCHVLAQRATGDARTKYVIWNRRIWSKERAGEGWRPYSGSNPHTQHMHVSIYGDAKTRDDVRSWWGAPQAPTIPTPPPTDRRVTVYNPPLRLPHPVAASAKDPIAGGSWLLLTDGSVYAFDGARYLGAVNGKPYWGTRTAARLELVYDGQDVRYAIVATTGERYGPGF